MNNQEIAKSLNIISEEFKKIAELLGNEEKVITKSSTSDFSQVLVEQQPVENNIVEVEEPIDDLNIEDDIINTPSDNPQVGYNFDSYENLTKNDFVKPTMNFNNFSLEENIQPESNNENSETKQEQPVSMLPDFDVYNTNFDFVKVDSQNQTSVEKQENAPTQNYGFTSLDDITFDFVNPSGAPIQPQSTPQAAVNIEEDNKTSMWGSTTN